MHENTLAITGFVFAAVLIILAIRFLIRLIRKNGISFGMAVCILLAAILAVPFAMNVTSHVFSRILHG